MRHKNLDHSLLIKQTSLILTFGVILVTLSYFFFDKPIAFWVSGHQLPKYAVFEWMTHIASIIFVGAAISVIVLGIKGALRTLSRGQRLLFVSALAVIVASYLKDGLKMLFGRYWPQTWSGNNLSLIKDNAYGFHFFQMGTAYQSFPSGHTAIVFCAMTILWATYPKYRYLAILLCLMESIGLIGTNYHFLGDILGGATLGVLCGLFTLNLSQQSHVCVK